jgi:WD40 repeat protein
MAHDDDGTTVPVILLGRYRAEQVIGEGAFGRVVRAFDTRLKRTVAIKTLKRTVATTDPTHFRVLEERFIRESEAGSRTGSHPNLVTVFDLDTDADRSVYLILEYVSGGNLADRLGAMGPLLASDAMRLTADASRGLQAAHDAGIVHRDVKPANIFLAADGRAQVGDFGVAQLDHLSGRTYAAIGHPGTPLYMSPEQAKVTGYIRPDSDQYSLGLVLFEMITGVPYKRLREREAAATVAALPAPIAEVFRRMTADVADDRYMSMAEAHQQIQETMRILGRSARAIMPLPLPHVQVLPQAHNRQPSTVTHREPAIEIANTAAPRIMSPPTQQPSITPPSMPSPTQSAVRHESPRVSRRHVLLGAGMTAIGGAAGVGLLVSRHDGTTTGLGQVENVALLTSPVATTTAAPITSGLVTASVVSVTIIPTPLIATATPPPTSPPIPVLPSPTATPALIVLRKLTGHTDRVYSVSFSPDGALLASGSGDTTIRLWQVSDGAALHTLTGHTDIVSSVIFAPVGTLVASTSFDKTVRLWSASDGALLRTLAGHENWVRSAAFTPDGQPLASASDDKTIRLWQTKEGTPVRTLTGHDELVSCVAISPDGRTLASGSIDKTIRLWQVSDGAPLKTLLGHTDLVTTIKFSPDGKTLASAGATSASGAGDATVRLWSVPDGALLRTLVGHTDGVICIAFSPDGGTLVTSSVDKTVRLWRVPDGTPMTVLQGPTNLSYSIVYAPDGRTFASGAEDNAARLWRIG